MSSRNAAPGRSHEVVPAARGQIIGLDDFKTILVADSDLNRRAEVADLFVGEGYFVVLATNGNQALALAKQGGIDLLVSAMTMTGMDGLELLWALRDAGIALPVIAVAPGADSMDQIYLRGASLYGAARAYLWPLIPDLFLEGVREVLDTSGR